MTQQTRPLRRPLPNPLPGTSIYVAPDPPIYEPPNPRSELSTDPVPVKSTLASVPLVADPAASKDEIRVHPDLLPQLDRREWQLVGCPSRRLPQTEEKRKSFVETLHEQHHAHHDTRPSNANRQPDILAEEKQREEWLAAHPEDSRNDYLKARDAGTLDGPTEKEKQRDEWLAANPGKTRFDYLQAREAGAFNAPPAIPAAKTA